jgi:hypothetical protein
VLGVLGKDPLILRTDIARQGYSQKRACPDTEECPSDTGDHGVVDRPWTPPQPNTPMRAVLVLLRIHLGEFARR